MKSTKPTSAVGGLPAAALCAILLPLLALAAPKPDLVVFDDGAAPNSTYYDPSVPSAIAPSLLTTAPSPYGGKMPLLTNLAFSGRQSGLVEWKSAPGGDWILFVARPGFQTQDARAYSNVVFQVNGPHPVSASVLPRAGMESASNHRTATVSLGAFLPEGLDGDSNTWQTIIIPLGAFQPYGQFSLTEFKALFFTQGTADNLLHTLWLDNLRITDGHRPAAPAGLVSRAGDRSVILHWDPNSEPDLKGYRLYRAPAAEGPFSLLQPQALADSHFADFAVANGQTLHYQVRALNAAGMESGDSASVAATPRAFADDAAFLEYLQQTAFDFFWYEANPTNGLVRDRSQPESVSSIAAVGFGLTAIGIGIDHGWITRGEGRQRVLRTLQTFWNGPQGTNSSGMMGYKGWFYHMLDTVSGVRAWKSELSSIDTALLLAGVLYAKAYFSLDDPVENQIRALADALFGRVDWQWMCNGGNTLTMGWHPETGFISSRWIGYNEAMILYIMGMGAATNPLPASQWAGWTSGYAWRTNWGQAYVEFPPLFGHQYSHCWIDFRHIADAYMSARGINYFENSRRATLAQRAYCIANPGGFAGYGSNVWGLTACDGPGFGSYAGYNARGAPPPQNDDGTLAPTAPGGSLPFAPEVCLPALRHLYDAFRTNIWCVYGFRDAFNLTANWWDTDVIGIDQGPILVMAENYRFQKVWRVFMRNAEIKRGLQAAGFTNLTFVPLQIRRPQAEGNVILSWAALTPRSYRVEYSNDLAAWLISPAGFITAGSPWLTWTDSGPPATESSPALTPQRFYRVLQFGSP